MPVLAAITELYKEVTWMDCNPNLCFLNCFHSFVLTAYTLRRAFIDLSYDLCSVQWEMLFRRMIGGTHILPTTVCYKSLLIYFRKQVG